MTHGCLLVSPRQGQTQTLQIPSFPHKWSADLLVPNDQSKQKCLSTCQSQHPASSWEWTGLRFSDTLLSSPPSLPHLMPPHPLLSGSVYHRLQKNHCFYLTHEMLANLLSIFPLPIVLPLLQEFLSFPWNNSSQSSLSWLNLDLIFTWQLSALDQMTFLKPKSVFTSLLIYFKSSAWNKGSTGKARIPHPSTQSSSPHQTPSYRMP